MFAKDKLLFDDTWLNAWPAAALLFSIAGFVLHALFASHAAETVPLPTAATEAPVYAVPYKAFTSCARVCRPFSGLQFVTSAHQCICGDGHEHWTELLP